MPRAGCRRRYPALVWRGLQDAGVRASSHPFRLPRYRLMVARRTGRQFLDFVLRYQRAAECQLVPGRLVKGVEHFSAGPEIFFRSVVTIQAPPHVQRLRAPGDVHVADGAVTGGAAHALGNVDAVIEIYEVGDSVDAGPGDGLVFAVAGSHGGERRA